MMDHLGAGEVWHLRSWLSAGRTTFGWIVRRAARTRESQFGVDFLDQFAHSVVYWSRLGLEVRALPALTFVEPNLSFALVGFGTGSVSTIEVGLDLEFRPPWDSSNRAGDPFVLLLHVGPDQLMEAAADWSAQVALYPNRLS